MLRSPNRMLAAVLGGAYLLLGGIGFAVTGDLVTPNGGLLFGVLQVNGLQNAIHLLIGASLAVAALVSVPASRATNTAIGTVLLLLGLLGLFLAGNPFNVLSINAAGNVLHFGSSVLLLAAGLGAEQRSRAA